MAKQKELEVKNQLAIQQKQNLLKERADATKREREERQRRVEQNNKLKEEQTRFKAEQFKREQERIRLFYQRQNDELKSPGKLFKSPGKGFSNNIETFTKKMNKLNCAKSTSNLNSKSMLYEIAPINETELSNKQVKSPKTENSSNLLNTNSSSQSTYFSFERTNVNFILIKIIFFFQTETTISINPIEKNSLKSNISSMPLETITPEIPKNQSKISKLEVSEIPIISNNQYYIENINCVQKSQKTIEVNKENINQTMNES